MTFTKTIDLLLNCFLPLLFGTCLYFLAKEGLITGILRNQLPDTFWAYSLLSCLLIIWNRSLPFYWYIIVFLAAGCFEMLQWMAVIPGTADLFDLLAYATGFTLVILTNKYFIQKNNRHAYDPF